MNNIYGILIKDFLLKVIIVVFFPLMFLVIGIKEIIKFYKTVFSEISRMTKQDLCLRESLLDHDRRSKEDESRIE